MKSMKIKYNEGGSLLGSSDREEFSAGGKVVHLITKELAKIVKNNKEPSRSQVKKAVDAVKENNPNLEKELINQKSELKDLRYAENYSVGGGGKRDIDSMFTSLLRGDTENISMTANPLKATKTYKKGQMKAAIAGAIASFGGQEAYDRLTKKEQSAFEKAFSKAHNDGKETFTFQGQEYTTNVRKGKNEGGSLLGSSPVDTYPNISPEEEAELEKTQLSDSEMEKEYLDYVLDESLEQDEQEYLMNALEGDERLSGIFDKIMDVAGEFSGSGAVEGPGTGVSDSIPARLSDGEFVFTKKATDQLGADKLQAMMDDAERAYDGGLMKKAFGGIIDDPVDDRDRNGMYMDEENDINKQMINSNRMPSVR